MCCGSAAWKVEKLEVEVFKLLSGHVVMEGSWEVGGNLTQWGSRNDQNRGTFIIVLRRERKGIQEKTMRLIQGT